MAGYVYPPVSFYFKVEIAGFPDDIGFQTVDGLDVDIPFTESYQEGGENTFTHKFPQPVSYGDLTLKRGMLIGSDLIAWFNNAVQFFIFAPRDVTVTLMNENGLPLDQWVFRNACPKGWKIDGFDSMSSKVSAETIVLSYQFFYRKGLAPLNT
jgi:phage tail-like protein